MTSVRLKSPGSEQPDPDRGSSGWWPHALHTSLHMRATALSTAKPRRTKTPERAHAARWWPGSMVRPHPADARRQGNGKAKSSGEESPETGRIDPRQWIEGSARQENTCSGTTLRSQHRLLCVCDPWEEVHRPDCCSTLEEASCLPTLPRTARFVVLRVARGRTNSCNDGNNCSLF